MYACCVGIKIIWCHRQQWPSQPWPTTAGASNNAPLTPYTRHCAPRHHLRSMGDDPLSKRIYFFGGWGGVWPSTHSDVTAMHHRQNKGALWGPYTPSTPQNYIRLLGGSSPINLMHQNESQYLVWCVKGAFPPSAAMVWWCFVACRSTNHFYRLNHGIVGIAIKLLSRARRFLRCVVLRWRHRDKREKKINGKQTSIP